MITVDKWIPDSTHESLIQHMNSGTPEKGAQGGHRPPCPLVRGAGGAKVPLDKNSDPKNMRYNDKKV
jgi:hypothetical protein